MDCFAPNVFRHATIEAALAGEREKGFAGGAQVVKCRSERSRLSSERVRTILHDIQKSTGVVIMTAEHSIIAAEVRAAHFATSGARPHAP